MNRLLEHDQEAEPGIPEPLPGNEQVLWKGGPEFRSLLLGSFRLRALLAYFGLLLAVQLGVALSTGSSAKDAVGTTAGFAVLALVVILLVTAYARLAARATLFTVTDRRVVLRTGVALPVSVNLPYGLIESAELRLQKDGSGDISLLPAAGHRVSWMLLWPMVKSFRWMRVRPVLRGLRNAEDVAQILGEALRASLGADATRPPRILRDEPREAPRGDGEPRWRPYPTIPLASMVVLAAVSLVAVGFSVIDDESEPPFAAEFSTRIDLFFEDQEDGAVLVRDAASGDPIDRLEPGTNGFVRATLRGLVRARDAVGAGREVPFTIGLTESGRFVLFDPVSERLIDLRAFGDKNSEAFIRFLPRAQANSLEPAGYPLDETDTAVALRDEDSRQ